MLSARVGLVYFRELHPLFAENEGVVSVLELEPETHWEKVYDTRTQRWTYKPNGRLLETVAALPQRKLLHGVGHPLGGVTADTVDHWTPLLDMVHKFEPSWVSEHLAFNRIEKQGQVIETGFLLPPRQTDAGVTVAVNNLKRMRQRLGVPIAFETGVNYLRPQVDEMQDGRFIAAIASEAQCGILLDLHNLWTNHENGRTPIERTLSQIPLDRVWEVHLAGGMPFDSYWLDSHSELVPDAVVKIAKELLPSLPCVEAVVFEILPQHVARIGLPRIRGQLCSIADMLDLAGANRGANATEPPHLNRPVPVEDSSWTAASIDSEDDVAQWESNLGRAVLGEQLGLNTIWPARDDPGVALLCKLVVEFRLGQLSAVLKHTMTGLLVLLGQSGAERLLNDYCRVTPPNLFPALEADAFLLHLASIEAALPACEWLKQVAQFERALVRSTLFGERSELWFTFDPVVLLGSLAQGVAPVTDKLDPFRVIIECPD